MFDHRDTAARRSATGLDTGARSLILRVVHESGDLTAHHVVAALFRDRYGSFADYYAAVEEVRGGAIGFTLRRAVDEAAVGASDFGWQRDPDEATARALLLNMPEADFRVAIERGLRVVFRMGQAADRIASICRTRGVPWRFDQASGFQWIGDAVVARDLVEPALTAINDPRFTGGVRSEFDSARSALRQATAESRKQAIHESGCCVESAMKVVLDERRIPYDARGGAKRLFERLVEERLTPSYMRCIVLAPTMPRNQTAAHGAGAIAHDPTPAEAESVVASAAGAIAYLHSLLPER